MDPITDVLLPKLEGVVQLNGYWKALCPAHEDRQPSMTIGRGTSQPIVIRCHAGCDSAEILAKIGLTWSDLCEPHDETAKPHREWTPHGDAAAVYSYTDEAGKLLFQVLRTASKQFPQRTPDATKKSGWRWNLNGTRRVLYRLPKVIEAVSNGELIYICEGEKDVHAIEGAGMTATCNPGGAGKWRPEYSEALRGAAVVIVADRDKPGQAHARQVAASLDGIAEAVEIVEPAGEGTAAGTRIKDVSDHLAAGHGLRDLVLTWSSGSESAVDLAPDLHEFLAGVDAPYDWIVEDILERGDRLVWTGFEGLGKALALDTPIPTPKGWTTMGELSVGDEVFGADGRPAQVTMATPVMTGHVCYRVMFSDGAEIIADAGHLWLTETLAAREAHQKYARKSDGPPKKRGTDQRDKRRHFPEVVTTEQIRETLMARSGHTVNHSVQTCEPLQYPAQELPVDPYVLGAWLGDGTSRNSQITSADMEIVEEIRKAGEICRHLRGYQWSMSDGAVGNRNPNTMKARLRTLDLLMNKHIPVIYLRASPEQRLALLQGLMDTDGTVAECSGAGRGTGAATCEFSVTSERLAKDARELMISLGIKVRFREGRAVLKGRHIGTRYRLSFQTDLPVFRLRRKAERLTPLRTRRARLRYILAVEPAESVPVRCIRVDNDDHLFLAGRECIPTHNSVTMRQIAIAAAAGIHPFTCDPITPRKVLWIDAENSERQGRRHFRKLERVTVMKGCRVPDGAMRLIHRPEGMDLMSDEDAAWLLERVTAHKPDLLYIGPLYRLHDGDVNEEKVMRRIVATLDQARVKADCALMVEHHSPHGEGANRSVRPIGSSLLRRWPELGYGLAPAMEADPCTEVRVLPWRGNRDERHWPKFLCWGIAKDDWPWVVPPDSVADAEARRKDKDKDWTPSGAIGDTA